MTPRANACSGHAGDALLRAYTRAVLAFRLGEGNAAPNDTPAPPSADVDAVAAKAVRLAVRSARPHLLLLGTGDGALPHALARAVRQSGACLRLTLCDLAPDRMRAALTTGMLDDFPLSGVADNGPETAAQGSPPRLLADTSPWALLVLLRGTGISPETATLFPNPFLHPAEADALLRWRRLFAACVPVEFPACTPAASGPAPAPHGGQSLGVGAILHPAEPGLEAFFAHIPRWVREVAVVWDGAPGMDPAPHCPVPVRQAVRPLGSDFAAQRNAMLGMLSTDWCLYLDADERLSPPVWETLPRLMALPGAGAWIMPRATAYPDAHHLRVGYGLWPDVQLRLFRNTPTVHFEGAVHEQVRGTPGHSCLLLDACMEHLSWIAKDRGMLAERLRIFDAAHGGGAGTQGGELQAVHRLSEEYPSLGRSLLADANLLDRRATGPPVALRLPGTF